MWFIRISTALFLMLIGFGAFQIHKASSWTHGTTGSGPPPLFPLITCTLTAGTCTGLDGGSITFTAATCNGSGDDSSSFTTFSQAIVNTWQTSLGHTGLVELNIPSGKICVLDPGPNPVGIVPWVSCCNTIPPYVGSSRGMPGIKNLAVVGYGAKIIGDYGSFGFYGIWQDRYHSVRTNAVTAGDTSVMINPTAATQLTNGCQYGHADPIAACLSIFSVGQTVVLMGGDLQYGSGYPQNPFILQYNKITAIDSTCGGTYPSCTNPNYGKITFQDAFTDSYKTTWPSYNIEPGCIPNTCFSGDPDYGGPVTLFAMEPSWDAALEIRGLNLTSTFPSAAGPEVSLNGRDVVLWDITCDTSGQGCPFPTMQKNSTWNNVQAHLAQMEADKMVQNLVINNSFYGTFQYQSSSIINITHNNTQGNINGAGLHTTVNNSDIFTLWAAATSFGSTKSYHINNSNVQTISFQGGRTMNGVDYANFGLNNLPTSWGVDSSGTIRTTNAWIRGNRFNIQGWNRDGQLSCWGGGAYFCTEVWKITDVTQDGSFGTPFTSWAPLDGSAATVVTFPSAHGRSAGDEIAFDNQVQSQTFNTVTSISNGSGCNVVGSGAGTQLVVGSTNGTISVGQEVYLYPDSANYPLWSSGTTYNAGDLVSDSGGAQWFSRAGGNLNNAPSFSSTWWDTNHSADLAYNSRIVSQLGGCGTPGGAGTYVLDVPQFQAPGNTTIGDTLPAPLMLPGSTRVVTGITNSSITGQPAVVTWLSSPGLAIRDRMVFRPDPLTPSAVLPSPLVYGKVYYIASLPPSSCSGNPSNCTQATITDTLTGLTIGTPISTTTSGSGSWQTRPGYYYVLSTGLTSTQFEFASTPGGTAMQLTTPGHGDPSVVMGNTYTHTTSTATPGGTFPTWSGSPAVGIFEVPAPDFTCNGCTGHPYTVGLNGLPSAPFLTRERLTITAADTPNYGAAFTTVLGNIVSITFTVNTPYTGAPGTGFTLYGSQLVDTSSIATGTLTTSGWANISGTGGIIIDWDTASPATRLLDTTGGGYPIAWTGGNAGDRLVSIPNQLWMATGMEFVLNNISSTPPMSITVDIKGDYGVSP